MLTKDLLRVRRTRIEKVAGALATPDFEVKPTFLKPGSKHAALADDMVALLSTSLGTAQGELKAQVLEMAQGHGVEPLVARGLLKTAFDASETEEKKDVDYAALRKEVFLSSSRMLAMALAAGVATPEELREAVGASGSAEVGAFLARPSLYGDLPEESPLTAFPYQSGAELIHRYNISLAQSLLVNARSLVLTLPRSDRALLRRLWKAFRFFGLVVRIEPGEEAMLRVAVEGPLSLHMHAQKYGFSLASFLPSLLCEKGWELEAVVSLMRGEESLFRLEPRPEVATNKRTFNQYTPPELTILLCALRQKAEVRGLSASESEDFLTLPGESACFPDFEIADAKGRKAFIEIFHPWHRAALDARVSQIARAQETPLVLAVSRKILKGTNGKSAGKSTGTTNAPADSMPAGAEGHTVLFRETPLVGDLLDAAERLMR